VTTEISLAAKMALLDARLLLLTDGWITGYFKCDTGAHCASGALRAVLGGQPGQVDEVDRPADSAKMAVYEEAATALADAMDPDWREGYGLLPEDRDLFAVEDTIFEYNDSRKNEQDGRDKVLEKFDAAAGL
jgi:hypothetical protein